MGTRTGPRRGSVLGREGRAGTVGWGPALHTRKEGSVRDPGEGHGGPPSRTWGKWGEGLFRIAEGG